MNSLPLTSSENAYAYVYSYSEDALQQHRQWSYIKLEVICEPANWPTLPGEERILQGRNLGIQLTD